MFRIRRWLLITLNLLFISLCLYGYLVGYTLSCQTDRPHHFAACSLRHPNGNSHTLQHSGQSLAYWQWHAESLTNKRIWLVQWSPYTYETVVLPDRFFEGMGVQTEGRGIEGLAGDQNRR